MVRTAVIIAAGNGSRFKELYTPEAFSKPLLMVGGRTLIDRVIDAVRGYGIERIIVVTGFNSGLIERHFQETGDKKVSLVYNPDWQKPNGISVLKAGELLDEPFLLFMADHIFNPDMLDYIGSGTIKADEALLLVDRNIDAIYDLNDATKVVLSGNVITDIGKDLTYFDAIDTGIFLLTPAFIEKLRMSIGQGHCSLSDGVRLMAQDGKMKTSEIGAVSWQDVDTPEAMRYAEANIHLFERESTLRPEITAIRDRSIPLLPV